MGRPHESLKPHGTRIRPKEQSKQELMTWSLDPAALWEGSSQAVAGRDLQKERPRLLAPCRLTQAVQAGKG
jgi:hypothetical protein